MSIRYVGEVAKQTYFDPSGFSHLDLNIIWFHFCNVLVPSKMLYDGNINVL